MPKPTVLLAGLDLLAERVSAQNLALYEYGIALAADVPAALQLLRTERRVGALVIDVDRLRGDVDGLTLAQQARAIHPGLHVIYVAQHPHTLAEQRKVKKAPTLRNPFSAHQLTGVLSELRSERAERAALQAA